MNPQNSAEKNDTIDNKGNFLKSMIKISHPDWTPNQIESEFQKQMEQKDNDEDGFCEACSG